MKVFIDENDTELLDVQRKTGLDIRAIFNEALTLYADAVRAKASGKDVVYLDRRGNIELINMPGLSQAGPQPQKKIKPQLRIVTPE